MDRVKKRFVSAAAAVGLAGVVTVMALAPVAYAADGDMRAQGVAAPNATQTVQGCKNFVADAGYEVGYWVTHACETGALGNYAACVGQLEFLHVNVVTADFACFIAAH